MVHPGSKRLLGAVVLTLVWAGVASLQPIAAEEVTAEKLKSARWYDYESRDYYQYKPQDIKLPEEKQPRDPLLPRMNPLEALLGFIASLFTELVPALATVLLILLVLAMLFFLARIIREQWGQKKLERTLDSRLSHSQIPAALAKELESRRDYQLADLQQLIETALAQTDWRKAVLWMYLYCLLWHQLNAGLYLHRRFTAREYARQIDHLRPTQMVTHAGAAELVAQLVACFEYALYRGTNHPDLEAGQLWSAMQQVWPAEAQIK
ncbi:MAG: hypothetical protein KDK39_07055 [Leptospiraceae bacterium]|nr:hypothetical protein [Leptospiraceae bacterium]